MASESTVLSLVERIYAAAYEPERWLDYALALREAAGATSVSFIAHAPDNAVASIRTELTGTAAEHRAYEAHFCRVDRWRAAGARVAPFATWASDREIADSDFAESEFYRDFLRHSDGNLFYFAGGAIDGGAEEMIISGILRTRERGPFGDAELRLMQALKPHLSQAVRLDRRFRRLRAARDAAGALSGRLAAAVFMLDARARLIAMNPAAEALIADADGLLLSSGGLAARRGSDDRRLQALIRAAQAGAAGAMALDRPSGRRPYWLQAAPAGGHAGRDLWAGEAPAVVLFVSDPERRVGLTVEAMVQQYGLTPQEARVAVLIAEGRSAAETATALGLAQATAETHLKRLMRKMGVRSRGALVALLVRSGGTLFTPD